MEHVLKVKKTHLHVKQHVSEVEYHNLLKVTT